MTRISLNVVVYNEEERLEECLVDARDFVDEIVVVDQMSTDGTPEIAERLADVYVRDVHHGHAEPSRELAASRSSGDWILILDADERMSDLLKAEIRDLVEGEADGYWIRKVNLVDGVEMSTVLHYRLVRKSRVRFDPRPHGGAVAVSDNVATFDRIGIVHEKTTEEQLFDDARYEHLALEQDAPTASKRNWLSHNRMLRQHRSEMRRTDLESLVPAGISRVLILGDIAVELPGQERVLADGSDPTPGTGELALLLERGKALTSEGGIFDAVIVGLADVNPVDVSTSLLHLVRPGGTVVGTAAAARNRRRMEDQVAGLLSGNTSVTTPPGGSTRRALADALSTVGFDLRWMKIIRDGWLNPVLLRPDGSDVIVESDDFLLTHVPAEVAEELTAEEIVFVAVRQAAAEVPTCSVVVAADGSSSQRFAEALRQTAPRTSYEIVLVQTPSEATPGGAPPWAQAEIQVPEHASLVARWNAGARAASGELLVFVTADTLPDPGWLDALVASHQNRPGAGAIGSKVTAPDGTIEHAGLVLGFDRIPYRLYEGQSASTARVNRPRIMPAVAALGMLTVRTHFVALGGFDETLGDDLSDADYCMRLRARGHPITYCPTAGLRSEIRCIPGTRGAFGGSVREFTTRWKPSTPRSDQIICYSDGWDANSEWNRSWRLPRPSTKSLGGLPAIAWSSHFLEQGGYTEEAIAAVDALDDAGLHVVANPVAWDRVPLPLPARKAERLAAHMARELPDDFVHVAHIGANRFKRHPAAMRSVGRSMFESDGLPSEWVRRCNTMDEVWVPCEHNLRSFAAAGVDSSRLYKVPETYDTEMFHPGARPLAIEGLEGFVFLSIFAWIDRKAWDVLLRAWFEEFSRKDDVTLLLKIDPAYAARGSDPRREIEGFVRNQLKRDPAKGPRIVVLQRPIDPSDFPGLYRSADAFVLPSRGEGWGRPYMEAMAMELPTIATRWSGNLEFMNDDNSYLIGYKLVEAARDSLHDGQRWAEPSLRDLRRAMRRVYEHRNEATAIGKRARSDVLVSCRPQLVAEAVQERIASLDRHPVHTSVPHPARSEAASLPMTPPVTLGRRRKKEKGLTACVVALDQAPRFEECVASLGDLPDTLVTVEAAGADDMASLLNETLERASGRWVLVLNANRTLDPASIPALRRIVAKKTFVGYTAQVRRQFGMDGATSAVEERTPFLFPLHGEIRYAGRVSQQLVSLRPDLTFGLRPAPIVLHEHGDRNDRSDPVLLARRHLPELERSVRDEPDQPLHLFNLGSALHCLGLEDEAENTLRRAISLAPAGAIWKPSAYLELSRVVATQGRAPEAVKLCKSALKAAPDWAQGWCHLADAQIASGRPEAALRSFARALQCSQDTWSTTDHWDDTTFRVRAGLGKLHLASGRYGDAADCLTGALAMNPMDPALHMWLAHAYEGLGRLGDARKHLSEAMSAPRYGPGAFVAFADFFTKKAEDALVRGLADNPESRELLDRIEKLRAARVVG